MPIDVNPKFSAVTDWIEAVDIHPSEPWLLTSRTNGCIDMYNLESAQLIHSDGTYPHAIWCVKFIARRDWYVAGTNQGKLHFFDCNTHQEVVAFHAHNVAVHCLAVHPTAPIVLSCGGDHMVKAWDWDKNWRNIRTYQGHTDKVWSITFNPRDSNVFASVSDDCTVKMWSIASSIPDLTINVHSESVSCVDFHPGADKPYLVTTSWDYTVKVWDYISQTCVHTMNGHSHNVNFAIFHPSLPIIISGSWDGTVKIWNRETYEIEHTLNYVPGWPKCIALRKGTNEVAVGLSNGLFTLELAHSGPPQIASSGNVSSSTLKEQVEESLEDRDIKEPMSKSLRGKTVPEVPEHELELARSLTSLTTAYDAAPSLTPPSTVPFQSRRVHLDPYQQCITLAMELMEDKTTNKLISELKGNDAQQMADLLSKMVNDEGPFTVRERKHSLRLLSKLAKSAEVFPQSRELEGVQCDLTSFVAAGGYGFIYKGEHEGNPVCVKAVQISSQGIDKRKMRVHASELTIWAHLEHLNVLPFLGVYPSKEKVSRICIVSPWMLNGDLLQYLGKVPGAPRKPLIRDIICGLQYLHDLDIIHADLKAKNVLISQTGRAMLADFGISRLSITHSTMLTNTGAGTAYWMAPELLLEQKSPSRESDIWAFACTCYEIIAGKMPFHQYYVVPLLIGAFMMNRFVPLKPEEPGVGWDKDVWLMAEKCWKPDPASRPKAHELLDTINNFDFPDDRLPDSESQRRWNDVKVDYDRILNILDEIRQSAVI